MCGGQPDMILRSSTNPRGRNKKNPPEVAECDGPGTQKPVQQWAPLHWL